MRNTIYRQMVFCIDTYRTWIEVADDNLYKEHVISRNTRTDFLVTRTLVLRAYKPHGPYEKGMTWTIPEHDLDTALATYRKQNGTFKSRMKKGASSLTAEDTEKMDKKNCKTGKRTKRQVEKILMVIDVKREIIDILQITNRRFMYNPQTGTLILGDEMYGKSICSSHAQEFHASQAEGRFDDYLRGWIGVSKSYPHGIVHFAPAVSMEQFDCGFDALQMFARLEGVNEDTIVRGFCTMPEQRMGDLLPSSL